MHSSAIRLGFEIKLLITLFVEFTRPLMVLQKVLNAASKKRNPE
jgi:hypothetical protein